MDELKRLILAVSYNGFAYKGWQSQSNPKLPTVQACLESALSKIAAKPITVYCAGRTDAGVHATSQVAHFIPEIDRPLKAWVQGVNTHLPDDIRVRWAKESPHEKDFHARFSATARSYRYIIHNSKIASAQLSGLVTLIKPQLDAERMHEAAQCLIGEQDFTSFRASGCQSNTPFRCVHAVSVMRSGDLIFIDIKANAFLLHMVRNIAGMLIGIGAGKYPVTKMAEVLAEKNRCAAEATAKPHGLYLVAVDYPKHFNLGETFVLPHVDAPNKQQFLFTKT